MRKYMFVFKILNNCNNCYRLNLCDKFLYSVQLHVQSNPGCRIYLPASELNNLFIISVEEEHEGGWERSRKCLLWFR